MSDGGEDQGAEAALWGRKKATNHHVSFGKSRLTRAAHLGTHMGPTPQSCVSQLHHRVSRWCDRSSHTSPPQAHGRGDVVEQVPLNRPEVEEGEGDEEALTARLATVPRVQLIVGKTLRRRVGADQVPPFAPFPRASPAVPLSLSAAALRWLCQSLSHTVRCWVE